MADVPGEDAFPVDVRRRRGDSFAPSKPHAYRCRQSRVIISTRRGRVRNAPLRQRCQMDVARGAMDLKPPRTDGMRE
jgi:hypothetical protein